MIEALGCRSIKIVILWSTSLKLGSLKRKLYVDIKNGLKLENLENPITNEYVDPFPPFFETSCISLQFIWSYDRNMSVFYSLITYFPNYHCKCESLFIIWLKDNYKLVFSGCFFRQIGSKYIQIYSRHISILTPLRRYIQGTSQY